MDKHWTERLFIDNASLYGTQLEEMLERTGVEVEGLMRLFSEHGVPPGGTVLDLACGIGRHSLLLAEKGYRVVGVDIRLPSSREPRSSRPRGASRVGLSLLLVT